MKKACDLMSTRVLYISPSDGLSKAAGIISELGFGLVPVCQHDKFKGVITEKDVDIMSSSGELCSEPVSLVMSEFPPFISPDDDILEAAAIMIVAGVRAVPVVRENRLVGLFTIDDLYKESPSAAFLVVRRISGGWDQGCLAELKG